MGIGVQELAYIHFEVLRQSVFLNIHISAINDKNPFILETLSYQSIDFHFYSILFYPIALESCRDTTDEFATIPFHLVPFSAALVELAKSIPVHSLILSFHLFFCLPFALCPYTVPCMIAFAKPETTSDFMF